MVSRLRKNVNLSLVPSQRRWSRPIYPEKRYEVAGSILRITTYLPRSVARRARREIYPYPYPKQRSKAGRSIRLSLRPSSGPLVKATVRIRMPRRLPVVGASYVSLSDGRMTIHSRKQLRRLQDAQEFNRRRYTEHKGNYRKGRYGQLESGGSQRFGLVANAVRRGDSIDKIGDAALVARAIGTSKGR